MLTLVHHPGIEPGAPRWQGAASKFGTRRLNKNQPTQVRRSKNHRVTPPRGFEPRTLWLTAIRSTNWAIEDRNSFQQRFCGTWTPTLPLAGAHVAQNLSDPATYGLWGCGQNIYPRTEFVLALTGFDPATYGLWAHHASAAPKCCAGEWSFRKRQRYLI